MQRTLVIATGFKPVTVWSVVSYSIQLSYATLLNVGRSDRDRIQTCNRLIRSQLLYSVELRGHSVFPKKVIATGFKPVTG